MTPARRTLIDAFPEAVHKGDFVMSPRDGVADSQATLDNYVVTPQLADAYDNALGFIASAISENKSKAAYLDGSFGSGKSHFMAVLHLLLQRDPAARAIPELGRGHRAPATRVLGAAPFELVPFHMIGAESMEQAIFGGYVKHVRETDPDAPLPGRLRRRAAVRAGRGSPRKLGDERVLRAPQRRAQPGGGGWGALERGVGRRRPTSARATRPPATPSAAGSAARSSHGCCPASPRR